MIEALMPTYMIRRGFDGFECPHCKARGTLACVDGDTVSANLDGERRIAGRLALSWRGCSYYACLNTFECPGCNGEHARVVLSVIDNAEVSKDWAYAYFWRGERVPEVPVSLTVACEDVEMSWFASCMATEAGLFTLHHFHPMISREPLSGPYGVARCSGGSIWTEAAELVRKMMPLVCETGFHAECRRVMLRAAG